MAKKLSKFIVLTIILLFAFTVPVFAREVTVDDLDSQINDLQEKYKEPIDSYYIIGNYVFTSHYKINTRDIMLAARSIQMSEEYSGKSGEDVNNFLKQMTIHEVERTFDAKYNPTGWKVIKNFVGETKITNETKLNIRFIDYSYLKDLFKVEFDLGEGKFADNKTYITVEEDGKINEADITGENRPLLQGKQFKEWVYTKDGEDQKWDFNTPITGNITLKATWYDEVNTDELLKQSISKIQSTDYGAEFKEGTITYNIYDKNKKNSEIKDTGLVGTIRDILKNENVKSLTISYDGETFTFDNAEMSNSDNESEAYKKLKELLAKVAGEGKDFNSMVLGDLVGKELTLSINLDNTKARSQNDKEAEEYKIKFSYNAQATLGIEIPENDKTDLKNKFNYTPESTYEIKGADGLYTVTGGISKQTGIKGFGATEKDGYYFAYTITLDEGVDSSKVKVKIPKSDKAEQGYNEATFDAGTKTLTVLMEVEEDEQVKNRDIIVEVEGVQTKIRIDFSNLELRKASTTEVKNGSEDEKLKEAYGWEKPNGYTADFTTTGNTVKVKGLIPYSDSWSAGKPNPFAGEAQTGYYLALTIETTENHTDETTVKFTNGYNGDDTVILGKKFDEQKKLYVLKHLHLDDETKTFDIVIDIDGDKTEYNPYTITVDWSELKLQNDSNSGSDYAPVDANQIAPEDKDTLEKTWGFDFSLDEINYTVASQPDQESSHTGLEGTVKQQKLNSSAGFGEEEGYYVPVKITIPTESLAEEYKDKWTIYIKDGEGQYIEKKPSATDYTNGYIVVLFKMKDGKEGIHYKVDYDGSTGNDYLISNEITITTDFTFLTENKITFEYFDETTGTIIKKEETVYEGEKFDDSIAPQLGSYTYHKFDYWYDTSKSSENGFNFENATTGKDQDITLKAHWTIDVDSFLLAVINDLQDSESSISDDFSEIFEVSKIDNTIKFKVISETALLSDMDRTSIPGTIAYLLQRGEIQDITLAFGGKKIVFTKDGTNDQIQTASLDSTGSALKEKIQAGAKSLFQDVLKSESADEATMTLKKMAVDDRKFTLTVGKLDDSVQLKEGAETEYTFNFVTDVTGVKNKAELKQALSNKNITNINILSDINVDEIMNVSQKVVINGGTDHHKLTASGVNTIFNVKSTDVTIENIKLADAKTPIVVESGKLTATGLTVEGEATEAAIEVKDGAALTVSQLTYNGENYEKPAVKAGKESAKVEFTDSESKPATKLVEKEKIEKYEDQVVKDKMGDTKAVDMSYNYYNYYNKKENAKIYTTTFHNHEARLMATFVRYNYYGENAKPYDQDPFEVFKSFNYDGETYTLIGFANSRDKTVNFNYDGNLPDGVIAPENVKATSDNYYYAAYSVKLKDKVTKVTKADDLKKAIEQEDISEIYIDTTDEMDLSTEDITINRKLAIIGPSRTVKLKVKSIKVTADDVFLHRLNLEFSPDESTTELINISEPASKFTLWQCNLKNVNASHKVNDAIKYSGTKATVDVRWNNFYADNINNTFINVDSALAEVTDIYGNTFKKLTGENGKKSAITIKKFDTTAKMNGDDETIRIAANTFDSSDYAIEILKDASDGNEADISLKTSQDIEIAVRYTTENKNFGNIRIHHSEDKRKITITYINEGGTTSDTLTDGTGVQLINPTAMQNIQVPEQATVDGLKLNGNTYSGIISQSEDGKFYLPVTLTSNDFKNNVSTVKVTNPNGEETTYTYSSSSENGIATVSNANTMKLQLEAIKSSKITGNNGKVYKLELDADGNTSNDYEIKEYTIDYSDVETLEEKINQAAKATLEANSFTVKKNNKINGYTEEFTYKYNANDGLTYLKAEEDNVEEYTFSAKYAGVDSSKLSVVARKRKDNEEDSKVYLNDWVYVHPQQVGRAIHEVTMLTDVMEDTKTSINAIDTVELVEGKEHNYTVKLNGDKYTDWVKNNYRLTSKYTITEWGKTVLVDVELDENDQYIKSIKTHQESSSNTFDVTFTNVNDTTIEKPIEFLAKDGEELTEQDIKEFYENGKKWWDKYIHENAYTQQ